MFKNSRPIIVVFY